MGSLLDTIAGLATGTYTVTRHVTGTWANGRYTKSASPTTFDIVASVQPAFNMNRIIGGRDLQHTEQGQYTTNVRLLFTITELFTRRPGFDPDEISIDGSTWTVTRVEKWDHTGRVHYKVVVSEALHGGP